MAREDAGDRCGGKDKVFVCLLLLFCSDFFLLCMFVCVCVEGKCMGKKRFVVSSLFVSALFVSACVSKTDKLYTETQRVEVTTCLRRLF